MYIYTITRWCCSWMWTSSLLQTVLKPYKAPSTASRAKGNAASAPMSFPPSSELVFFFCLLSFPSSSLFAPPSSLTPSPPLPCLAFLYSSVSLKPIFSPPRWHARAYAPRLTTGEKDKIVPYAYLNLIPPCNVT